MQTPRLNKTWTVDKTLPRVREEANTTMGYVGVTRVSKLFRRFILFRSHMGEKERGKKKKKRKKKKKKK